MAEPAAPQTEIYLATAREMWHTSEATALLHLRVTSESMRPLLQPGDEVVVQRVDPDTLRPGEVIVVERRGEWITHRLISVDQQGWHAHGDNTRTLDEPANATEVVGRVIAIARGSQTFDLQQPRWRTIEQRINRVQRLQGWVFTLGHRLVGNRSRGLRHGMGVLINWPFQTAVRWLIRI